MEAGAMTRAVPISLRGTETISTHGVPTDAVDPAGTASSAGVGHGASHASGTTAHSVGAATCLLGVFAFVAWMGLFGAGIMVDTSPFREAISEEGARLLRAEGQVPQASSNAAETPAAAQPPQAPAAPRDRPSVFEGWAVALFCFLPLNLAWLCLASSTLGAVGNLANLGSERDPLPPTDTSNPILSAVLRGFFVYLFLMSGLLVLDQTPFSNAGPSQYIRLGGFLSLFSFLVSYHPQLFGTLVVRAFERIQVRSGDTSAQPSSVERRHVVANIEEETVTKTEPARTHAAPGPEPQGR
jgi:hypothetical protein